YKVPRAFSCIEARPRLSLDANGVFQGIRADESLVRSLASQDYTGAVDVEGSIKPDGAAGKDYLLDGAGGEVGVPSSFNGSLDGTGVVSRTIGIETIERGVNLPDRGDTPGDTWVPGGPVVIRDEPTGNESGA